MALFPRGGNIAKFRRRLWAAAAACGVLLLITSHFTNKASAIAAILDNCYQSTAEAPGWAQELAALKIQDGAKLRMAYCTCAIKPVFDRMSSGEIRRFSKLTSAEQVTALGGAEAIGARHQQCLKKLQQDFAAQPAS